VGEPGKKSNTKSKGRLPSKMTPLAVWRSRGDQKQLVGEFAFQCKLERGNELHAAVMKRCEQFFVALQHVAEQWLALGTTKTGVVYRLKGNPPTAHE
jgi:hypothetical protein